MKSAKRFIHIGLVALLVAVVSRYATLALVTHDQNTLTDSLCDLVSLPLETGLVRDTHEALENVLMARGEKSACVSVVDNGRSYSPDCLDEKINYRAVVCKAKGNRGIRASIYYPQMPLFGTDLLIFWFAFTALFVGLLELSKRTTSFLVLNYSNEVSRLLYPDSTENLKNSVAVRCVGWTLKQFGIAQALSDQAQRLHDRIRHAEEDIQQGLLSKERLEIETDQARRYKEKIDRIHHDIRSPISSLQSIYEKLAAVDARSGRALANAIKRIQESLDDIGRIDVEPAARKLVIVEVVAEEVVSLMAEKFNELKSATLELVYDQDELSPINVDAKAFQAALENLLENALDAISVGGVVSMQILRHDANCVIVVEDNGVGISDAALENLGIKSASVGKLNGTGLGLYHSVGNVIAWGGSIFGERLARGSRFTVAIPLMQTGVTFSGLPHGLKLNVIDDDPLVAEVLSSGGYDVLKAARTFEHGRVLLADGRGLDVTVLVDHRLDHGLLGSELIAGQPSRKNIVLCTNDFDDLNVVKRAKAIGTRIVPKPLCFYPRRARVAIQSRPPQKALQT